MTLRGFQPLFPFFTADPAHPSIEDDIPIPNTRNIGIFIRLVVSAIMACDVRRALNQIFGFFPADYRTGVDASAIEISADKKT